MISVNLMGFSNVRLISILEAMIRRYQKRNPISFPNWEHNDYCIISNRSWCNGMHNHKCMWKRWNYSHCMQWYLGWSCFWYGQTRRKGINGPPLPAPRKKRLSELATLVRTEGSPVIPGEGVNVERLEGQAGVSFNLSQIEAALEKTRPKAFFITHGESSTGCLQNLEGIGALCHKHGALCCVDSVAACGGVPLSYRFNIEGYINGN